MEIGGFEHVIRVTEYFNISAGKEDSDVVVNTEVRIVRVFVLTAHENRPTIGHKRERLPEPYLAHLPELGRFLTKDTKGGRGHEPHYAYCDNNPLIRTDAAGADWQTGSYLGDVWEILKGEGRALNQINWVTSSSGAGKYIVKNKGSLKSFKTVGSGALDGMAFEIGGRYVKGRFVVEHRFFRPAKKCRIPTLI